MAKAKQEVTSALPVAAMSRQCPTDEHAAKKWPTLTSCLNPIWKDGKCTRQSGRLSIRLIGAYYLVALACPTEGMETSLTTDTLVDLFDQLEARLRDPACVWVPDWENQKKSRQVKIESLQ